MRRDLKSSSDEHVDQFRHGKSVTVARRRPDWGVPGLKNKDCLITINASGYTTKAMASISFYHLHVN